ncbi:hypothetical protein [Roseomonas mucosa]|uniref:hypothetical protein n=1 Tax=Roseomonas mucosa TaxID=207340 RepID=UPI00224681BB|nr:hypothetical protein [Roseomonas mucosa]UZO94931.1 Hypothetical protein RMP42_05926 [Roseomonas mucosa]
MPDQLLGWLAYAGGVLLAATLFLNRLSAFLNALAGVVNSARALERAVRPAARVSAQTDQKAVTGEERADSRPNANNQS